MTVQDSITITPTSPASRPQRASVSTGQRGSASAIEPRDLPLDGVDGREALRAPAYLGPVVRRHWVSVLLRISMPLLLVLVWWIGTATEVIPNYILAEPSEVWTAFTGLWQSGDLTDYVIASFWRVAVGLGLGLTVGLVLGVLTGLTFVGEALIDPTMQMMRAVPFLALVPLYLAWFGIDETFKVVLIATSSALPMYAYAYLGVRSVDRKVVEAARGFGLNGWRLVARVILPSALPNVLMALRICLVLSMTALISAEGIGTEEGIGYLVLMARQYARTDYTMLCIVLYAGLGLVFDLAIRIIERYSMPWRRHTAVRG